MEQTALRPKPMPGRESGDDRPPDGRRPGGAPRRPHAARRRGRRFATWLFGLCVATGLVLSGVGLGTVGAAVIGMSRLAELQRQPGSGAPAVPVPSGRAGAPGESGSPAGSAGPGEAAGRSPSVGAKSASGLGSSAWRGSPARLTLGVEAVDVPRGGGALVVGVHQPGPGASAGLVRGDVLLALGATRVDSAEGLARAVAAVRSGSPVTLTVRHANGARQRLSATPGVVT